MAGERRAPYLKQLEPFIVPRTEDLDYSQPNLYLVRTRRAGLLEVRKTLRVEVPWTDARGRYHLYEWVAQAGDVLRPAWRDANRWELQGKIKDCGPITHQNGQPLVQIVEWYPDIFALARQVTQHIPEKLMGVSVQVRGEKIAFPGELSSIRTLATKLATLSVMLRANPRPEVIQLAIEAAADITLTLGGRREHLLIQAKDQLQRLPKEGRKLPEHLNRVVGLLLSRNEAQMRIAQGTLNYASRVLATIYKIQSGIDSAYKRLGQLIAQFPADPSEYRTMELAQLLAIAREAKGIWHYLDRVGSFNPYYRTVHDPEVAKLAESLEVGKKRGAQGLAHLLWDAFSHLGALVRGERIAPGEITRIRRRLAANR